VINGLIFDIKRFTVHDGPGIRTTVFFKGCPLRCWWCHNPESQDFKSEQSIRRLILSGKKIEKTETTGILMTVDEVMKEVMLDRMFYEESGGGVTFSGGEPLMQGAFLLDLLTECKRQGLRTALDTSGYASREMISKISQFVDLFLYDLKLMDLEDHKKYTGVDNQGILENLIFLFERGKRIILRFPVIPGITNTQKNIAKIKDLLRSFNDSGSKAWNLEIDLLPYHTIAREKYHRFKKNNLLQNIQGLTKESMIPLKNELESIGVKVKIGG